MRQIAGYTLQDSSTYSKFEVHESSDRIILKPVNEAEGDYTFKLFLPAGCQQKDLAFVVVGADFEATCAQNPSLSPSRYLGGPYAYSKAVGAGGELALGPLHLAQGSKLIIRTWGMGTEVSLRDIVSFVGIEVGFEMGRLLRRIA